MARNSSVAYINVAEFSSHDGHSRRLASYIPAHGDAFTLFNMTRGAIQSADFASVTAGAPDDAGIREDQAGIDGSLNYQFSDFDGTTLVDSSCTRTINLGTLWNRSFSSDRCGSPEGCLSTHNFSKKTRLLHRCVRNSQWLFMKEPHFKDEWTSIPTHLMMAND